MWRVNNYVSRKRGEIATTLTIFAVMVMTLGIFVGSRLTQQSADTRARAVANCPLAQAPTLTTASEKPTCRVAATSSKTLVCALIDPSKPASQQLVAGQDPAEGPNAINWIFKNGFGTVPLYLQANISINKNATYRIVAYDWTNPESCVKERNVSGESVASIFSIGGNAPTNTPIPSPSITKAPTLAPTLAPTAAPTSTNPFASTPTPTPVIDTGVTCLDTVRSGSCKNACGPEETDKGPQGCDTIRSSYTCCVSKKPTSTPTPTATPIPQSSSTGTTIQINSNCGSATGVIYKTERGLYIKIRLNDDIFVMPYTNPDALLYQLNLVCQL